MSGVICPTFNNVEEALKYQKATGSGVGVDLTKESPNLSKELIIKNGKAVCPKCGYSSGDDWSQCNNSCPLTFSPHYKGK